MELCLSAPVDTDCCVANVCFKCRLSVPDSDNLVFDIYFSNWIKIFALFAVGIWNIMQFIRSYKLYRNSKYDNYFPMMRLNNIIYAIGTGIFIFSKTYYQLSKPTFILASIHNLCEWVFTSFAFFKTKEERRYVIFGSFCYILTIIGVIVTVSTEFEQYALVEQVTGLGMDFMLPMLWIILYLQNRMKSKNTQKTQTKIPNYSYIYLIAFIAHSVHLFLTILPVLIDNLTRNQNELFSRIIQFIFFWSVPLTHILYTIFTSLHEKYIDLPNYNGYSEKHSVQTPSFWIITTSFRRMIFWYIINVFIGLIPLVIIPGLVMLANNGEYCNHSKVDLDDNFIIGTAIGHVHDGMAEAFEYDVLSKHLVSNARNYDGNVFYHFTKATNEANTYLFIEGWKSKEAVNKWINSEYVGAVFNDYTFQMLDGNTLQLNSYIPVSNKVLSNKTIGYGSTKHVYHSWNGCEDIWKDVSDLNNCEWIFGCDHIKDVDTEKKQRIIVLKSDDKVHGGVVTNFHNTIHEINEIKDNNYVKYRLVHYIEELQRLATITLINDGNINEPDECMVMLSFETNIDIQSIDEIYKSSKELIIPFLQQKYESIQVSNMPNNIATHRILKAETPLQFINTLNSLQSNASLNIYYHKTAPYLYTNKSVIIFNNVKFNGFDQISKLYSSLGGSRSVLHSWLIDPIIERNYDDDTTLIIMTSNIRQETINKSMGCDYSYPLYVSLQITNKSPIKIMKLHYNTPKYVAIEQSNVLNNCQYLLNYDNSPSNFEQLLYSNWNGFKIINNVITIKQSFGELWKPYFAENSTLRFNNTIYVGIDSITEFHDNLSHSMFGGFRFYIISLISNDKFITLHLRGNVMSIDLKQNYNDNFRMVIEYHLNKQEKIVSANYHIDTNQLNEINMKFGFHEKVQEERSCIM